MEWQGKRTPLFDNHVKLGARMVPFAGFLMPLQYSGQLAEHTAVRNALGLFDLSHMGEFRVTGRDALGAVDRLLTNRVLGTQPGQAVYSPMCREDGGIVDDLIAYHLSGSVYLVVNASNIDKDETWVREHLPTGVHFENLSDATALLAVQGGRSQEFLAPLTPAALESLGTYCAVQTEVAGVDALVSRTGYTGEDGFELYVDGALAPGLWNRLLEEGRRFGMIPIGLAARDTLRFEMGYCLYGNDIDDTTTPLEAGLAWTVKLDKGDFLGRGALVAQKAAGIPRRLIGFRPEDERTIPRPGYLLQDGDRPVGKVTSGTFAPSLARGLGMGYVESTAGSRPLTVDVRGKRVAVSVVDLPFYREGSRRAPRRLPPNS
jgi:aminomethyltransferase